MKGMATFPFIGAFTLRSISAKKAFSITGKSIIRELNLDLLNEPVPFHLLQATVKSSSGRG
jgi:hypothetical protein